MPINNQLKGPDISIGGNTAGATSLVSLGTAVILGGSNVTLSQNGQSVSIIGAAGGGPAGTQSVSGGGTSITGTAVSLAIVGGNNISLASAQGAGSLTLSINASSNALNNVSLLNGSSGALSLVAGASIGFSSNASTITISASSSALVQSSIQISSGNTAGVTTNITSGGITLVGGNNVTLSQSLQVITLIGPNVPAATNFSLNGSSSSVSLVAGAGIGFSYSSSTISISASNQTSSLSYVAALNGSSGALSISAGANIGIGNAANSVTISASNQSALVSIGSITAGGATSGTANTASSTAFQFVAGSNITLSQLSTNPSITIIGPTGGAGAAGTQSLAGGGTSVTGTAISLDIVGGNNISIATATGVGALTVTLNASSNALANVSLLNGSSGALSIVAGLNIGLSTNASNITISVTGPRMSYTANVPLQQVGDPLVSGSGTASQTMLGSSLFLDRVYLHGYMNLSEIDMAMSMAFATTSVSGSMNRSMVLYSFANSTSLASVLSASQGISFTGSNTTTGTSTALSQVAAGWTVAGGIIVPMTFASSSISPGDYVMGNIVAFSLASSASVSLFGIGNNVSLAAQTVAAATAIASTAAAVTAFSAAPTVVAVMSSNGLLAASALTASGIVSAQTAAASLAITNVEATSTFASSASSTYSAWERMNAVARTVLTGATGTLGALSSGGLLAGSFYTASGSASVLSNSGTAAVAVVTNVAVAALGTTSIQGLTTSLPAFQYLGASSVLTGGSFYEPFQNALMSTGGIPAAITLTTGITAGLTVYGSTAAAQPWFALVGV